MSTIKLPPPSFYHKHEDICGNEVGPPTPFWNQTAVEEAVCQALAAQASALYAFADRQYCAAIEYARRDEALGWESKAKSGRFGADEYACHKKMNEAFGAHFGIYEALKQVVLIPEKDHGESPQIHLRSAPRNL